MWQWTFFRSALFAANETIFWRFLSEIFPLLPENKNSCPLFFCRTTKSCNSSTRNSGMLKILSLFPFACLTCPIFSEKFRFEIFRFVNSETRNPHAYIRLIMSFDFSVLSSLSSFLTSSFERVVGSRFSFFGRLIVTVMSLLKIVRWAYFIAERKSVIDVAALSVRFSAIKSFVSSVVIWSGDFSRKSINFSFALM